MNIQAIIFDLDGTLLDTLDDLGDSVNHVLEKYHYPQRTKEEIRSFIGNGIKKLIERALPYRIEDNEFEKVFNDFQAYYQIHCLDKTIPYPHILELLKMLKEKNYKTAIISNKSDDKVQVLKKAFFPDLIDLALGTKDFAKTKPNPESTLQLIHDLNVPLSSCLFVGDSEVDIQTAHNANIPCVSVSWGFKSKEALLKNGAQIIIDTPLELIKILDN